MGAPTKDYQKVIYLECKQSFFKRYCQCVFIIHKRDIFFRYRKMAYKRIYSAEITFATQTKKYYRRLLSKCSEIKFFTNIICAKNAT